MNKAGTSLFIIWMIAISLTFFIEGVQCSAHPDDFYAILEVPREATKAEVKKAYRSLSKRYHPDKNPGDEEASSHYKLINRAYEVLSDDNKRQQFDHGGIDGLERFER